MVNITTTYDLDAYNDFKRSDYPNDVAFLCAVANENMRRQSPEFLKAFRLAANRLMAEQEAAEQKATELEWNEAYSSVTVSADMRKRFKDQANERASVQLSSGRISAAQFDATASKYAKDAEEHYKRERATSIVANRHFRNAGR